MDVYTTEEQQIEAIKRWWKANGNSVLIGIAVAIAAVLGWQTWTQGQQTNREQAAVLYGQLIEAAAGVKQKRLAAEDEGIAEQTATLEHIAEELKNDFPDSEYAVFAALAIAKEAVFDANYDKAVEQLSWAKDTTGNQGLKLIANLRLARVLAQTGQHQEALAQLDSLQPGVQTASYEEVRGDIYLAMGDDEKARQAYEKASVASATQSQGKASPLLEVKLANLKVAES